VHLVNIRCARAAQDRARVIRAELTGNDTCSWLGITARSRAPVLELCRKLIKAGVDPATTLHAYRGDTLALVVSSIGQAARLTVKTAGNGAPIFVLDSTCRGAAGPPIAPTVQARVRHQARATAAGAP
jgi:hypothetical protein